MLEFLHTSVCIQCSSVLLFSLLSHEWSQSHYHLNLTTIQFTTDVANETFSMLQLFLLSNLSTLLIINNIRDDTFLLFCIVIKICSRYSFPIITMICLTTDYTMRLSVLLIIFNQSLHFFPSFF